MSVELVLPDQDMDPVQATTLTQRVRLQQKYPIPDCHATSTTELAKDPSQERCLRFWRVEVALVNPRLAAKYPV
jgi:hypothetical protein